MSNKKSYKTALATITRTHYIYINTLADSNTNTNTYTYTNTNVLPIMSHQMEQRPVNLRIQVPSQDGVVIATGEDHTLAIEP